MRKLFVLLCLLLMLTILVPMKGIAREVTYPNNDLLISVEETAQRLNEEHFIIVDTRSEGYTEGHIPGALPFDAAQLADKSHPVDGYLVRAEEFERLMNELGISNDDEVIVYDDGDDTAATRLFYALELYGHKKVRVLNGGLKAWKAQGKEVSTTPSEERKGSFKANMQANLEVEHDYVKAAIDHPNKVLFDVRSKAEYMGEDVRAKRGGHIPSAVNLEWKKVLEDGEVPYFKEASAIEQMLEEAGVTREKQIIIYCQKAERASHMYFTLRLMGFEHLRMYEGSWEEWGNDPDTPIVNPSEQ
ncbi:sulfurtransferase [Alkalihalophilus marmarensis]|uniref:thiosulfate sulfurtransferase n=1 Tax=Alkalihalophilus marmarensis DSM 21297 TaxID=1188261 RepID=U6SLF1_9BACI|nr:sulfurtransferase [Alkalihalophilus marmarensis]ERN51750.1 hypothetical protein A33I_01150 [Alkalihalophilus marmarensis DSM 21297]MCM3491285.1 sulfurtransferase [Alkalihalophilus marmarensis]